MILLVLLPLSYDSYCRVWNTNVRVIFRKRLIFSDFFSENRIFMLKSYTQVGGRDGCIPTACKEWEICMFYWAMHP